MASLGELAAQFGCELIGDPSASISGVATLSGARDGHLSFFANKAYRDQLRETRATAVLLREEDVADCPVAALVTADPYLSYARMASCLHPEVIPKPGIHASAVIASNASVAASAEVSPLVSIDDDVSIGAHVFIGAGVVIGPRCRIGDHCRIYANVTLVRDVRMGDRSVVHPGAVIGSDGFGNARGENGWEKVPQIGGVSIGCDVEIGANTTIDRGAVDDTVIEDGVRLDNLIQIAHNVRIGAHTAMAAFSGVSGSTTIGKRCMFAGQSGIVGHISICDDVVVGGATMISKNITEPGFYTGSFPGEKDRDWKRKVARFRRLGELTDRVSKLERMADKNDD